ncbi:MAG: hypothetical protein M3Z85_03165 [Acidobacteriota bacterium]|nr:hypothetical protein [Acidobacteriota bacterium]
MDVHGVESPIHSWKDFLLHLATITIGILIALSLEGILEWSHHRSLVREAKASLNSEILDNKKELDGLVRNQINARKEHQTVLRYLAERMAHKEPTIHSLTLNSSLAQLSETSWNTAGATGALAHMEYREVKKYSGVYQFQRQFERVQERTLENVIAATTAFAQDPEKLSERELEDAKQRVLSSLSSLQAEGQLAEQLSRVYAKALEEKR